MNFLKLTLTFFVFLFMQSTLASLATDLQMKILCSTADLNCVRAKLPMALQAKIIACENTIKSESCQKFIKEEPEFSFSLKRCETKQFCEDQMYQEIDSLQGCKSGFLIGTGENFTGLINLVSSAWANIEKNADQKLRFLKACEASLDCRKELAKDVTKFKNLSNADLMKQSIMALYSARVNHDNYADLKLEGARTRLERLRQERASGRSKTPLAAGLKFDGSLMKAADDWLRKKLVRLECVDQRTQAELKCWAAAYILDPTLVAGASAKVPTAAARAFSRYVKIAPVVVAARPVESLSARVAATGAPAFERRVAIARAVDGRKLVGTRLRTLNVVPNLPDSLAIAKYRGVDGVERTMMEKAVKMPNGEVRTVAREIQIDPLTGAIDANSPGGRDLLNSVLHASDGKATVAFIDVNNLGYVNKNFMSGSKSGDDYLRVVSVAIQKATDGKAQFYKLGGDEFGLVINETDPKKVKEILDKVIKETYGPEVHSMFRSEKIAQASEFRSANNIVNMTKQEKAEFSRHLKRSPELNDIRKFAPYSRAGISVGSTRVGRGEDLESVLVRAENGAKSMKVTAKEAGNIDAKKYGGRAADINRNPDLRFVPEVQLPTEGIDVVRATSTPLPSLKDSKGLAQEIRGQELHHVGEVSVVSYTNASGQKIVRYERYAAQGSDRAITEVREIIMNEKTELIDATKGSGEQVANLAISNQRNSKAVMWINAENLGKVNYFEKGTAAGDDLLAATSEVIRTEVHKIGIPFKGKGSEFAVVLSGLNAQQVASLNQKVSQALLANPKIKQVYAEQRIALQNQLRAASGNPSQMTLIQDKLRSLDQIQPAFTVRSTVSIPVNTDIATTIKRLKERTN